LAKEYQLMRKVSNSLEQGPDTLNKKGRLWGHTEWNSQDCDSIC